MMLPKFLMFFLLVVGLVFATDPKKDDDDDCDDRDLGIKRDMSVQATKGRKDGQYVWSSIVSFDKKELSKGQMVSIVHEASEEMREQWDKSIPRDKRPSIMTAIEVDGKVYLASSMKGDYSFIYEYKTKDKGGVKGTGSIRKSVPSEIRDALQDAKQASGHEDPARTNDQHKNDASCGELMASYTYLLKHGGKGLRHKAGSKPRTVAWLYKDGAVDVDKAWDPCGTDDKTTWGCDAFCKQMGFEVIPVTTPEDKKNLPKVTHTEQQQLMTKELRAELDKKDSEEKEQKKKEQDEKKKEADEKKKKAGEEKKKKAEEEKKKKEEEEKKNGGGGGNGKRETVWQA